MQKRLPTRTPSTSIGCASAPDASTCRRIEVRCASVRGGCETPPRVFSDATLGYWLMAHATKYYRLCLSRLRRRFLVLVATAEDASPEARASFSALFRSAAITMSDGWRDAATTARVGRSRWRLAAHRPHCPRCRSSSRPETWRRADPNRRRSCAPGTSAVGVVPRAKYSVITRSHARTGKLAGEPADPTAVNPASHLERVGLVVRRRRFHEARPHRHRQLAREPIRDDGARLVEADPHAGHEMRREADEPRVDVVVRRPGLPCRRDA